MSCTRMFRHGVAVLLGLALIAGCSRSRLDPVIDDDPPPRQFSAAELAAELSDPDPDIRFAVVLRLRRLGPKAAEAVPALTKALRDRDLNVRSSAADALASIGAEAAPAVPALAKALNDADIDMRRAAAAALGAIGPAAGKAVAALQIAIRADQDEEVRRLARLALRRIESSPTS